MTSAVRQVRFRVDTAEYKQVTVLFADVVRSMDIAAALDMERLREIMTELVERSAAVVRHYGGTVEYHRRRRDGDLRRPGGVGGSRFSGMPGRPGHPGGDRTGWRPKCSAATVWRCELRVGLNSGRVIAGEIGSGSLGYAAIGEQVGLAQRMESVAPAGRGDAVRVDRAAGRAHRDAGRTGVGAHQGGRRTGFRAPAGGDRAAAWPASGAPRRAWSVGAARWPPLERHGGRARSVVAAVWWVWWGRRASASPGWRGRPRRWRPVVGSRCCGPSASRMPATFPSRSWRSCCGRAPAWLTWTATPPAPGCGRGVPGADPAGSAAAR